MLDKTREIEKIVDNFRLLDDDFMSKVFDEENNECIQFVLRIILNDEKLVVESSSPQKERKSITGHSVKFDVYAKTGDGKEIDVEIQRADRGAVPQRARYNSALLDSGMLDKESDYSHLKPSYVIFITEHDVLKNNKPLYHIDRKIKELDNADFNDGSHIIYVNGEYVGNDKIGQLVHDFRCTTASEMRFDVLKNRVKYFKEEGGRDSMCKSVEDFGKKVAEEAAKEAAEKAAKEAEKKEKEKTISSLLKTGATTQWIHETLNYPMELIEQVQNSIGK